MVGAKKWLLEALEGTDEYAGDGERKDSVQMQTILEAWDNPTSRFKDEMALPIPKLLAGYSLISPSAATTPVGTPRTLLQALSLSSFRVSAKAMGPHQQALSRLA